MTTKQMILDALKRLIGSMKAWTMLFGLIAFIGAKEGFKVDPATYWTIAGAFATLLGVQGASDWGKSVATTNAKLNYARMEYDRASFPILKDNTPPLQSTATGIVKENGRTFMSFENGALHDVTDALMNAGYHCADASNSPLAKV